VSLESSKQVWRGIVSFANADAKSPAYDEAWDRLATTLANYMPFVDKPSLYDPDQDYQSKLRKMLSWLCAENPSLEDTTESIAVIREHIRNIDRLVWFDSEHRDDPSRPILFAIKGEVIPPDRYPDPYPEPHCRMWQLHLTRRCDDCFDMLCDFIVSEHTKYHDRENRRARKERFSPLVPIRRCDRLGCPNFTVVRRTDRKAFCSPNCCAKQHQREKPQEEKSDAQFLWRLSKADRPVLRAQLRKPEIRSRLEAIQTKWPRLGQKAVRFLASAPKDQTTNN
jgi:hypothetical protein